MAKRPKTILDNPPIISAPAITIVNVEIAKDGSASTKTANVRITNPVKISNTRQAGLVFTSIVVKSRIVSSGLKQY